MAVRVAVPSAPTVTLAGTPASPVTPVRCTIRLGMPLAPEATLMLIVAGSPTAAVGAVSMAAVTVHGAGKVVPSASSWSTTAGTLPPLAAV
ncbi:MAG: hypothetical protein J0I18_16805 [Actinobacteria bacterium]|nr:hypothetical protein [Actinomycetota bacterium]